MTREQVVSVYRQVLEREPREEEIKAQLSGAPDLDALLRIALESEEYAARLHERGLQPSRPPTVVNIFHPDFAEWTLPPGTRSHDGIAIVGREGWLFLCGGTNANLEQFTGAAQMGSAWLDEWQQVLRRRATEAGELGVSTALLVVPDKLAVYEEQYPEDLTRVGPRPIERLLSVPGLPLTYPLDELRAAAQAGEEVYLRTDTHLTFRGNQLLFASVLDELGIDDGLESLDLPHRSYPIAGDLGSKFEPQILSIVSEPNTLHRARIVEDNSAEIESVGGHIGMRYVFRNDEAPDARVAVIFGDSFARGAAHYQGVSWFFAQVYREVHFVWIPFGWDPDYVRRVGAAVVLFQAAERFVARVPQLKVDATLLTEETLRRKRPAGAQQVFE